ncbi:MAG TPA: GTPase Era [Bryobacteraceae bacterium]|jgi:GTP-binding protein Era|nr:GTPase Era [Bryobacteraceae bacterium]
MKTPALKRSVGFKAGFVAILGRPNAGKSTLLNALVGTKLAIVASKPQTTRTSIQGVLTLASEPGKDGGATTGNAQIVFVDTPGIHKSSSLLSRHMMDAARGAVETDLLIYVVDALAPASEEDARAIDLVKKSGAPAIAVLNKVDRLERKPKLLELIERYRAMHDFAAYIPISARTGKGLDVLLREIIARLPKGKPLFPDDYLTDQPERFRAAELVREKILRLTEQEVPHSVAVMIETWEDTPKLLRIGAVIYVERAGQKAILIGPGGALLKRIGTEARQDLERLLDRKVFLQTFVKVHPRWREQPEFLAAVDWRAES